MSHNSLQQPANQTAITTATMAIEEDVGMRMPEMEEWPAHQGMPEQDGATNEKRKKKKKKKREQREDKENSPQGDGGRQKLVVRKFVTQKPLQTDHYDEGLFVKEPKLEPDNTSSASMKPRTSRLMERVNIRSFVKNKMFRLVKFWDREDCCKKSWDVNTICGMFAKVNNVSESEGLDFWDTIVKQVARVHADHRNNCTKAIKKVYRGKKQYDYCRFICGKCFLPETVSLLILHS